MLRKLKLYGELAEFVGHKEFEIQASSIPKVISFLINNFPQIEQYMNPKYYQVKVGNYAIDKDEIHHPIGEQEDIHIVPVITGAGGSPTTRILIGAALIGAAFLFTPLTLATFGSTAVGFGSAAGIAKGVAVVGAALALNGVSEMLFPLPKLDNFDSEEDPRLSFSLMVFNRQTGLAHQFQ